MAALILTNKLSQSTAGSKEPRVRRVVFGNGYEQRSRDGINNIVEDWSLVWDNITQAEMVQLETFLDTLAGTDYFTWTPPGGTEKKFVQTEKMNKTPKSGSIWSVTLAVRQVFDL